MANGNFQSSKKRFVERVRSIINASLTTSAVGKVLHEAEDRETLVRTIIDFDVSSLAGGTFGGYAFEVTREPAGVQIYTPTTVETLDQPITKELIYSHSGSFPAVGQVEHIHADLKSMRKLDPGDELVLRVIADNASSIDINGTVTQFLKQM